MDDNNNIFDVLESVSQWITSTPTMIVFASYLYSRHRQAQAMIHDQNLVTMSHLCGALIYR